ncbi:GAF domain-containing protein [Nocardia brasiliensis]|uniref:GAF domain-containing protein n=1 Tax=Nocardia brasiliensis TaxID=37326 RepID=UPI0024585441|nr:GAF domain-containing protein [Nocardia brasiliensis]
MQQPHDEVLIETIGTNPRVVWASRQARDTRITNLFRGAEGALIERLVKDVVKTKTVTTWTGRDGNATGRIYAAHPVVGPDNAVNGVQLVYGASVATPTASAAAFQWTLDDTAAEPPRLHATWELLDLLEVPPRQRDRALYAYGPLDFFNRVARLADLVQMWEAILTAEPGYAEIGTVIIRTSTGRAGLLLYAQRQVQTEAGPRLRVLCQDITDTADMKRLRRAMYDMQLAEAAVTGQGMYGCVLDARWPSTCILRWLTPFVPGFGHGISTGQTAGVHPEDQLRVPVMLTTALETGGGVHDSLRVRPGFGSDPWIGEDGWMTVRFHAQLIDPEVAPTLALSQFYPNDSTQSSI